MLDLVLTNGYLINPSAPSACLTISDILPTNILPVATLDAAPIGIDYDPVTRSLLISQKFDFGADTSTNFALVSSNGVVSAWSRITGLLNEVKVATVKQPIGGFTNGDMFYSSGANIGWLSADGTRSNLAWCILTNSVVTNAQFIRGSFYWDEAGVWSNQLIVVTGDDLNDPLQPKGVWRVNAQGRPTLVANILTSHLEGVITLANNVTNWGPWAGKILTGDEAEEGLYAIDTNGVVETYNTTNFFPGGIQPEDFDIIQTNQNLYACDQQEGQIVKLSEALLGCLVGGLMITDAGEFGQGGRGAKLFIVNWSGTNMVTRSISYFRWTAIQGTLSM